MTRRVLRNSGRDAHGAVLEEASVVARPAVALAGRAGTLCRRLRGCGDRVLGSGKCEQDGTKDHGEGCGVRNGGDLHSVPPPLSRKLLEPPELCAWWLELPSRARPTEVPRKDYMPLGWRLLMEARLDLSPGRRGHRRGRLLGDDISRGVGGVGGPG